MVCNNKLVIFLENKYRKLKIVSFKDLQKAVQWLHAGQATCSDLVNDELTLLLSA